MVLAVVAALAAAGTASFTAEFARADEGAPGAPAAAATLEARFPLDPEPVDRSGREVSSYASAIGRATPSVVSVYTANIVRVANLRYDPREDLLRRFFGLPRRRAVPRAEIEERRLPEGVGSGVIVSPDGYILTNNHVVTDSRGQPVDEVMVQLSDRRELPAAIVGRDELTDIALLKVEAEALPAISLADSDNLMVGDVVFAIGNPMQVGLTVTMGIVSATGRSGLRILGEHAYESFIQTDASINPGNSGGALVDSRGRLVGINTAILSRSGGNIGIGFAVPVRMARAVMISLIENGAVRRGLLGADTDDLTADVAEALGLDRVDGALVVNAPDGLPAAEAGIRRGDVIVAIDGRPVRSGQDVRNIIAQSRPGSPVQVRLLRDGNVRDVAVALGDLDDPLGTGLTAENQLFPGVAVARLTPELGERYGVERGIRGLAITAVDPGSSYRQSFRPGMVVLEINDVPVESIAEARRLLRRGFNRLWLYEKGQTAYLAVRIR